MGTVPVPYSPIAGDDATQARVLTWADSDAYLLGSATSGGSKRPLVVLRQTVAQAVATATLTAITFDTEDVDYDNGHSTVTNTDRYTAATAGWHWVAGTVAFSTNAVGARAATLAKNGAEVPGTRSEFNATSVAAETTGVPLAGRLIFLAVGDFLQLFGYQTSGGALNTQVAVLQSSLSVEWRSN